MPNITDRLAALKVAIYIRVSTHWQIDKDSLQVQRRELIAYAQMVLGIQDFVVFEDPGYSAKNTDRPDYQKMMDRLRTGEFSHLLVWKIDRISRNLLDFANMYEELKKLGVTFVSKNEQFDTSSAIGEAMLKIILIFAELERNMTAERVTAVMLSRANNGQWNGGRVPYGYDYNKDAKKFYPNSQESRVVFRIYELYEREQSLVYVARYLNEHGVRPRSGKDWTPTTVHKILTNVFYIGKYRYNVHQQGSGYKTKDESEWITIEDHHEPIVDDVLFERIQFLLKRNKRGGVKDGASYTKKNIHVFAGLLRCGNCGTNMSATLDRIRADGWRPSVYGCAKRRNNAAACSGKFTSDVTIGPFVFNYIANIIRTQGANATSLSLPELQKLLLKGSMFSDVATVSEDGLSQLHSLLLNGVSGMEYRPVGALSGAETSLNTKDSLLARKRKHETALNRLRSLYLYGDEPMAEKDFIIERQRITDQLSEIDEQLSTLKDDAPSFLADDEFMEKASYFIMAEKLLSDKTIDFEKYIRQLEPSVPRAFLRSVVSKIEITDGRVTAIEFKNGMTHRFSYK